MSGNKSPNIKNLCNFVGWVYASFLDSNIYLTAKAALRDNPEFQLLFELVKERKISVVITDIVFWEVIKHRVDNEYEKLKPIFNRDFLSAYKRLTGQELGSQNKQALRGILRERYTKELRELCENALRTPIVSSDVVKFSAVLSLCHEKVGFFSQEAKKDQYPDAFNFETLKTITNEGKPLIIVSKDKDFKNNYVKNQPCIELVETLSDLFAKLEAEK